MDISTQIVMLFIGAVFGLLAAWYVQFSHSKLTRTLELIDEFNSDDMLLSRTRIWFSSDDPQLSLIRDKGFSQAMREAGTIDKDDYLFQFVRVAWFFRKVKYLAGKKQIEQEVCKSLLGTHFRMYWERIFLPAMGEYTETDIHFYLWKDLESLSWLREDAPEIKFSESPFRRDDRGAMNRPQDSGEGIPIILPTDQAQLRPTHPAS
jgi:hypothetical protein